MKILSFNINGLKSSLNKGLNEFLKSTNFDIICLQEIKCCTPLLRLDDYFAYYNYCNIQGYSGTAIFTKQKPISVSYDLKVNNFNFEGRIIILEFKNFYIINVYAPNSKSSNVRINYRMNFDEIFYDYIIKLDHKKPVIICGDLNADFNYNEEVIFSDNSEIDSLLELLDNGFVDTYEELHKESCKYTWHFNNQNVGYRLDYFIISNYLLQYVKSSDILDNINCSDHFPIVLELEYNSE